MTDKDEIRRLNGRIESMRYQIKQLNDYKEENIRLQKGYSSAREDIQNLKKDNDKVETQISYVFNSFKNLINKKGKEYLKIKSSYNRDMLERMRTDNKYFEEQLAVIDKKAKNLLDDLYSKVKQYCSSLSSGSSDAAQDNNMVDIEAIKFNLNNILNEFSLIFNEIQNILTLSSQFIAEEDEETLRNINMIEIIIQEVDRLLRFVPNNEMIRNGILGQLGINPGNYPINTPTIRIILTNLQEVKRKRQTQLRSILDEIKIKSSLILTKKADIENEIKKAMDQISNDPNKKNSNNRNGESLNLENLFLTANQTSKKNIKDFGDSVIGKLKKEIADYTQKVKTEEKEMEDIVSKIKEQFLKQWIKIKDTGCEHIFTNIKNESHIHFEPKLSNYQEKTKDIIKVLKEKFLSPECIIIKQALLHCTDTIDKIKKDITPVKCVIPIGKKNNYLENLNELLVKNLPFIYYGNDETINSVYNDTEYSIKRITGVNNFEIIFPILIIHYNDYSEFENDIYYIEKLIVNCLKKKVSFLFFFDIANIKDLKPINKKINTYIEKSSIIQTTLKESGYQITDSLGCNMGTIESAAKIEMEKLTDFKKDIRCKIDKPALKIEYFEKMFDVYNTHPISNDLLSIKNAQDEVTSRHRLVGSIMDYSLLSVNLDKKPKTRQLKEKEEITLNAKVEEIIDNLFENVIMKDYKDFIDSLIRKKSFDLYLEREKIMADFDIQYNTSLLTEEMDGEQTKSLICKEIETIIEKKYKKDSLKFIGKFIWTSFFERYCSKFYKLFEQDFRIPEDFDQYLVESLNV